MRPRLTSLLELARADAVVHRAGQLAILRAAMSASAFLSRRLSLGRDPGRQEGLSAKKRRGDLPRDTVDAAVSGRIRALRVAVRLTRKELAEELGISADKLLNVEVSRSRHRISDVKDIARILGARLTDLLGDFAPLS